MGEREVVEEKAGSWTEIAEYRRVIQVREPYERLLSAYRDKFFLNGDAKYEHAKVRRWYMRYGAKIIRMYRTGGSGMLYS